MANTKLKKFGNFLLYGGWLLILVGVFAIIILASYYMK